MEALRCADTLCKQVNEGVRRKENLEHLEWLQIHVNCDDLKIKFNSNTNSLGPRKLLHYGMLQKVCYLYNKLSLIEYNEIYLF